MRARRTLAMLSVASLAATGSALLIGGVANADTTTGTNDNRYALTAEGDGMYAYVYNGLLPAVPYVDAGAYTSEAENNSQGNSSAFAGLPYAGKTGTTLPGTVNGLSGGNFPPLPPLPGFVSTSYPSSKDMQQSQGPYLIHATSGSQASSASAGAGVSPNAGSTNQQIFSTANVVANPDGSVLATATAGADAVSIGPIDILNLSSSMTVTSDGKSAPKVVSKTNFGTVQVLGYKLGLDNNGFTVLGAPVASPTATVLGLVNTALGAQGLKIEVIPGERTTSKTTGQITATSAELRVTETKDVPIAGPTTVIFTFGRAMVSLVDVANDSGNGSDGSGSTGGSGGTTGTTGDTGAAGTGSGSTTGAAPAGAGAPDLPRGNLGGGSTGTLPPAPTIDAGGGTTTAPTGPSSIHPRSLGYNLGPPKGTETWAIYLVLVLAGVGVVGGQQLFRTIGIQLALRGA